MSAVIRNNFGEAATNDVVSFELRTRLSRYRYAHYYALQAHTEVRTCSVHVVRAYPMWGEVTMSSKYTALTLIQ